MKIAESERRCDRPLMTWDDTFNFSCKPGIDCFNSCCRDVTIFLNPLDVIRLRNALEIPSTAFLHKYTDMVISPVSGLPAVVLRMTADEQKKCPFVTEQGLRLYMRIGRIHAAFTLWTPSKEWSTPSSWSRIHVTALTKPKNGLVERWRKEQGLYVYDDLDHNLKDVMSRGPGMGTKDSRFPDAGHVYDGNLRCGPFSGIRI